MNIKNLGFNKGVITDEGNNKVKVIPIVKQALKYLNVGYRDDCCAETFCPVEPPCSGGSGDLYLERTYTAATTDIGNDALIPGALYKITDRNIFIEAISTNKFALEGTVQQYCPSEYAIADGWNGVYNRTLDGTDIFVGWWIWGGKVWLKNGSSIVTASDDFTLTGDDINLVDPLTATNGEYVLITFGCHYDFANDWIVRQWDNKGNIMGCSKDYWTDLGYLDIYNPCTLTDWNNSTIKDNNTIGIFNTTAFRIEKNVGVKMLILDNYGNFLTNNTSKGIIARNYGFIRIEHNESNGDITDCGDNSNIQYNKNNGNITFIPANTSVEYCQYNGDIDGAAVVGDINGRQPKEITTSTYTTEPWDWNNIYRPAVAGDVIITLSETYIGYNCTHVAMDNNDLIFQPQNVFVDIFNADGHTKSNGQYAPVVLYNATTSYGVNYILGGNTKA
jgi:hypothetical protein